MDREVRQIVYIGAGASAKYHAQLAGVVDQGAVIVLRRQSPIDKEPRKTVAPFYAQNMGLVWIEGEIASGFNGFIRGDAFGDANNISLF